MDFKSFTGGIFETNCFFIEAPLGNILIDAPQECADWLEREKLKVDLLLLTHGHVDHVLDAARVCRDHGCPVGYHKDGERMLTEPEFFRKVGFGLEIEPVKADFFIDESPSETYLGLDFQVLLVPGHCPGSLCFYQEPEKDLFGGDVLFAGGIGRWDLPGGDLNLLLSGIKHKILPLPDDVRVMPGHGPETTIGRERAGNPFLADLV